MNHSGLLFGTGEIERTSSAVATQSSSAVDEIAAWFKRQTNFEARACLALWRGFHDLMRLLGVPSIAALDKSQKTVLGTVAEHAIKTEFGLAEGKGLRHRRALDFHIMGHDVDSKFSIRMGSWMIPSQVIGRLCLLIHSADNLSFWMGLLRIEESMLRCGVNQDKKRQLQTSALRHILWLVKQRSIADVRALSQQSTVASPWMV